MDVIVWDRRVNFKYRSIKGRWNFFWFMDVGVRNRKKSVGKILMVKAAFKFDRRFWPKTYNGLYNDRLWQEFGGWMGRLGNTGGELLQYREEQVHRWIRVLGIADFLLRSWNMVNYILRFKAKKYLCVVDCPECPIPPLGLLWSHLPVYQDVAPPSVVLCKLFHSTREKQSVQKVLINAQNSSKIKKVMHLFNSELLAEAKNWYIKKCNHKST